MALAQPLLHPCLLAVQVPSEEALKVLAARRRSGAASRRVESLLGTATVRALPGRSVAVSRAQAQAGELTPRARVQINALHGQPWARLSRSCSIAQAGSKGERLRLTTSPKQKSGPGSR